MITKRNLLAVLTYPVFWMAIIWVAIQITMAAPPMLSSLMYFLGFVFTLLPGLIAGYLADKKPALVAFTGSIFNVVLLTLVLIPFYNGIAVSNNINLGSGMERYLTATKSVGGMLYILVFGMLFSLPALFGGFLVGKISKKN